MSRGGRGLPPWLVARMRPVGVGLATGTLAGMGAFMGSHPGLTPPLVTGAVALGFVLVAGAYTHLLAVELRESITAALVALAAGGATVAAAWVAPLWWLQYPPGARAVILPGLLQRALSDAMATLLVVYLGGYFATVLVAGYWD